MSDVWVSTREAADLAGVTERAVQKASKLGRYRSRAVNARGDREVLLSTLPARAQEAWVERHAEEAVAIPAETTTAFAPAAQMALVRVAVSTEEVGMDALADPNLRPALERDMAIYNRYVEQRPEHVSKGEHAKAIMREFGISRPTLFRIVKTIREKGLRGRVRTRPDCRRVAWDKAALDFMSGTYLKSLRNGGEGSKIRAFEATLVQASGEGWQVGSRSSAYEYLSAVSPLLQSYAVAGRRSLDNYFYLMRDLTNLRPFQVIVGDQHTFDRWVVGDDGVPFRMQCFLWLDMFTRVPYGVAFDPQYSGNTVASALRMGLMRFGRFENSYTDNGKPELSTYMAGIFNQLRVWNIQSRDLADLYKTEDGAYVVEDDDDGAVVGTVDRPEDWHEQRHIRAGVRNAKAKPIERFFRTLEGYMDKRGVPGRVVDKGAGEEVQEVRQAEIDRLKAEGNLLSPDEFVVEVLETLEYYENTKHGSLGMTPMEKLMEAVHDGWRPTYLAQDEIDFVFLAPATRKVQKGGRIRHNKDLYEAVPDQRDDGVNPLTELPIGTRIEIRYNRRDPDEMVVILPSGTVRKLQRVVQYSMLDDTLAEGMRWKREQIKKVVDRYRELTKPIPELLRLPRRPVRDVSTQPAKREVPQIADAEAFKAEVDAKVAASAATSYSPLVSRGFVVNRPVFKTRYDRYKWCLSRMLSGYDLVEADRQFAASYPSEITQDERDHWREFERMFRAGATA